MFFCEFCEIYKNTFLKTTSWRLLLTDLCLIVFNVWFPLKGHIFFKRVSTIFYISRKKHLKALFWKRIIKNPRKLQINFCFWIQFLFMEIILKNKRDVELFTRPFSGSQIFLKLRSSHRRCSVKKGVLKNFVNFTGKHLCWCLFLITSGLQLY